MNEDKEIIVEFSKDINNAQIGIIGAFEDNKKIVKLYKIDRNVYNPKLKPQEVCHNVEYLKELENNSELICKLVFYNNESIESLIYVLFELYSKNYMAAVATKSAGELATPKMISPTITNETISDIIAEALRIQKQNGISSQIFNEGNISGLMRGAAE